MICVIEKELISYIYIVAVHDRTGLAGTYSDCLAPMCLYANESWAAHHAQAPKTGPKAPQD